MKKNTQNNWGISQVILDELLKCNSCQTGFATKKFDDSNAEIDYLVNNLPTLPYVLDQFLNFMFSNGLTTGDEQIDSELLDPWLYKINVRGVTNYAELRNAMKETLIHGKCGIRWLSEDDGIICTPYNQYVTVLQEDKDFRGFKKPIAYALSAKDEAISLGKAPIDIDKDHFDLTGQLLTKDKSILIIPTDDFVNLRTDVSLENGKSKLDQDRQRLQLVANVYERLNYDIEYDGPGRLIFWLRDTLNRGSEDVPLDASQIVDESSITRDERAKQAQHEVEELANQIKNSSSDNVILGSTHFENQITHIPRVTKATEFLEYLQKKEGSIVAQCFGITPELLGLGDVSGNVSMEKIIDNAMINTIVPMREIFATQFSPILSRKLGVNKVYFDKYELKQSIDISSEIYKLALSVTQLVGAVNNSDETSMGKDNKDKLVETAVYLTEKIAEKI